MPTSWNNSRELLFALIFLNLAGVKCLITSPPQNTATKVGSQTYLNCSGNNGVPGWRFGEYGKDFPLIVLGSCSVSANYTSKYSSEAQGSNTCNLIILNPSLQESGIYSCLDSDLVPKYAVLTVLSSSGTPTVNNGSEVVEGDQLTINCTVMYGTAPETSTSAPTAPILSWTTSGIIITSNFTTKTNISVTSSITVVATRAGIPSYNCTAHFLPPANKNDLASNAPSNVNIGATYPITGVYYPPTSVEINRTSLTEKQCIYSKTVSFTCHATSNPPSSYEWMDLTSGSKTSGQLLQVSHKGTYQCVATTTVRGKPYSANASTTVLGCEIPGNATVTVNGRGQCNNGVCDCGGHDTMELECHASGIPAPYYTWRWTSPDTSRSANGSKINVYNGTYTCTAFNEFEGKTYNTSVVVNITGCSYTPPTTKASKVSSGSTPDVIIPAVVVPCWVLLNLIAMSVFLIYYNGRDPNGKHEHRKMLNNSYSWLKLMLPCFNESSDAGCSQCLWVFLFVLMSVTVGVIVFPILIIKANCTFPNDADKLSTASTPTSTTNEMELRFSEIGDTRDDGGTAQGHSRPSGASRDPSPYEEFSTTTSHPSKLHPQGNKDMKQKHTPMIPTYAEVNKAKPKTDVQESNAQAVPYYPDNFNNIPKATVPLPPIKAPQKTSAPNPNSPVYSELNVVSESNSRRPVQFLAEQTDPQYAQLKDT